MRYAAELSFYWLSWLQFPLLVMLMIRINAGHELLKGAVCPSVAPSEDYTEQSDWRR